MTPMKSRKARIPAGLRRTLAAVAISAVAVAGWQLHSTAPSGIGVMGLPGATADPTGPPGPTGGLESGGGSQFQPPGLPPQQPDYQGGINQPPLDQNNGISIYNTGAQGAPQQAGQQGAQQGNPGQQPQHGNQLPDYQTATPHTQGPGQANPNYQAPQQGNQGQQPQQQQPSQAPTQTQQPQNKQDDTTQQLDQKKQQCQAAAAQLATTAATTAVSKAPALVGGGGRSPIWWLDPKLEPSPTPNPNCPQGCSDTAEKPSKLTPEQQEEARQIARDEFKRLKQEEKDKFPWEKIAEGAVVGCGTGAVGGAMAGLATAGVLSAPAAGVGCVGGAVTGVVGAIGVWAFGQWTNNMKPMN